MSMVINRTAGIPTSGVVISHSIAGLAFAGPDKHTFAAQNVTECAKAAVAQLAERSFRKA